MKLSKWLFGCTSFLSLVAITACAVTDTNALIGATGSQYQTVAMLEQYVGENRQGGFFSPRVVYYMDDRARVGHEVFVEGAEGKLVDASGVELNAGSEDDLAMFVMDETGVIYLSESEAIGQLHHSSFLAGGNVAAAGEMLVREGRLILITNRSGHYRPPPRISDQVVVELRMRGAEVSAVRRQYLGENSSRLLAMSTRIDEGRLQSDISQSDYVRSGRRCGTRKPSLSTRGRVSRLLNLFTEEDVNMDYMRGTQEIKVPVHFHVLHNGDEGKVSMTRLSKQIDVLNHAYRSHGVKFEQVSVDYTDNKDWFEMGIESAEERAAKKDLGKSHASALNFYIAKPRTGELGWATWPWELAGDPEVDGVVVLYTSLPDGEPPFDEGDTGVHEAGHWLGLYHTFDGWDPEHAPTGGCRPPGDHVSDTPFEASPAEGPGVGNACPAVGSRDTCDLPGADPIDNFMNYADDRCMNKFTFEQRTRLRAHVALYRPHLIEDGAIVENLVVSAE